MLIDLGKMDELGSQKNIKGKLDFDNLTLQNREIRTPEPLNIDLTIYKGEDSFAFSGELFGKIKLQCSRCLEFFNQEIKVDIDNDVNESEIGDFKSFNLNKLLEADLLLVVPIKPLCEEDCAGICPNCGIDLNNESCNCSLDVVDPRMAKLKELYDNNTEEVD